LSKTNIEVQISALRKAQGEHRNATSTVSLRGYRFTAEVHAMQGEADAAGAAHHRAVGDRQARVICGT
jgi:DNA-binding winged helix-turn-helix (wHTH) protein